MYRKYSNDVEKMKSETREQMANLTVDDIEDKSASSCEPDDHVQEQDNPQEVEDQIKEEWERQQNEMKDKLILEDVDDWARYHIMAENASEFSGRPLEYIGGVDISFIKGDNVNACAALVVLNYPDLEVVYEDLSMVELTAPYISGFLAFREADFLVEKINKLKETSPELMPQLVMVDGNGILHPRGFGLACHLGLAVDLPCLGVAKNLLHVDGVQKNKEHMEKIKKLEKGGDTFPLIHTSGSCVGMALRSHDTAPNPVYVSQGHKLSLDTAIWAVKKCCKYRVPEPTRQADIRSREYLRQNFGADEQSASIS